MIRLVLAALAAVPLLASAQDAAPVATPAAPEAAPAPTAAAREAPPLRDGVYLGIGLGGSRLSSPGETLGAYRVRLGMTRSPRLQFGLEFQHAEANGSEFDFTDVSATFFPWRRIFFVRGGFGFSSIVRTKYVYGGPGLFYTTATGGSGINLLAGVGAQLGSSNGVNFTVNLEAQGHRLKSVFSAEHDTESTLSAWLGLEWH